ncbi:MAG: cytosine permease [Cyanobacteriota/Melainabacteria group bacterium]|nr:cytosine permease [Candidatus Obscuribacterales bacterium]
MSNQANPANQVDISHADEAIPEDQRRNPVTMGLLWITMVTFFPGVLQGFIWFKEGLSFMQVVGFAALSCLLMLAYAIPACHIGSSSGWSYGGLIRSVFGRSGNKIVACNLVFMFIAWYGLCSLFLAENLHGLFHFDLSLTVLAPILSIVMAFNNFWGFKGVANFARFFAAPLLIFWVGYTFFKTIQTVPMSVLTEPGTCTGLAAFAMVANFIIGVSVWGNEADYWRYGRSRVSATLLPVAFALTIGQIIFPTTGWLVGRMTGITDYAGATAFMNDYSFGGIAILGALVLSASYFAANDSNLYGSTNALNHLVKLPHRKAVTLLTVLGALVAVVLSGTGCAGALEKVASLNCVLLAVPTVIIIAEYFIVRKLYRQDSDFSKPPRDEELPAFSRAAVSALLAGCLVGVATAGVIPGLESWHQGICSIQGWACAIAVYTFMRGREIRERSYIKVESDRSAEELVRR